MEEKEKSWKSEKADLDRRESEAQKNLKELDEAVQNVNKMVDRQKDIALKKSIVTEVGMAFRLPWFFKIGLFIDWLIDWFSY